MLEVGIHEHHAFTGGHREAGGQGGLLAEVAREIDRHHIRTMPGDVGQHPLGGIRAVVDDDQFGADVQRREHPVERLDEQQRRPPH
jgi:hypothetical protein